ncbi:uncharacterized protein DEA37_0007182 [Paragonimus westermani]|uniref:Ionotropic glutamate receptor L-glutamate and glycine-binding domain-containing protein n=1 Tax=Paragonimus westermani TaxID=34504 RepID=A0A5J4NEN3_9TREM|nr:uncharacterized protein DEA37_0007182 [Paragonimus westermani]
MSLITAYFHIFPCLACRLIAAGVQVIISMTSCSVAKYIEVITNRHQILQIAIPKPLCPDIRFPNFSANNLSFGTLWIQPDPKHIAKTLESIIKMEHVPRAFIFSDGTSGESCGYSILLSTYISVNDIIYLRSSLFSCTIIPSGFSCTLFTTGIPELLLKNTNNHTADNEFDSPVFSPHAYQVQRGRLPSVYAHKPGIADLGQTLEKMGLNGTIATAVRHAYLFTVEPHVEVELSKVRIYTRFHFYLQNSFISIQIIKHQPKLNNFFWILGEGLDLPVNRIIHVLNTSGGEFMNLGFLSYNPLLSLEDSKDFLPDDPLIDGMRSMFNGDFQNLPVAYYENRDRLTFYSLEKPINETARFRATAHFSPGSPGMLTNFGKYLLDQTMISGLFANRFVNFHKRVLKLGVVMEEPLIMGGQVLENGQLVNATGMTIDLLEILVDKFNFKYELYQPRDGQYGIKNGSWTGLMRDLIEQYIDLIASPVTVNNDRSQVVSVVGQFMDSGIGILLARSSADPPIHQMFQPFKYSVWLLLGGSFLLVASLAYATNRFSPKGWRTTDEFLSLSSLNKIFNLFLLKERGIIHRLRQKWWFTVDKCTIRDTKYRPITVQNSAAALITLCSFICLSLVVLLTEIFWSRMVRNNEVAASDTQLSVQNSRGSVLPEKNQEMQNCQVNLRFRKKQA